MAHIFLVRHGEVEGNSGARRTFVGWGDKPLTARGEAQAQAVARRLKRENLAAVYSSDLQRARLTAQYIAAEQGLEVQYDKALREANFGLWEGLSQDEILAQWQDVWERRKDDPAHVGPPDGENLSDVWSRWQPAWQKIVQNHKHDVVAIVAHNSALRVLMCHLLGSPLTFYRRIYISNCGITRVDIEDTDSMMAPPVLFKYINETHHLEDI